MKNMQLDKQVKEYIIDCINPEAYGVEAETIQEKLQFLYDTFIREYWYPYNEQQYKTKERAFSGWCMGLPAAFHIDYTNNDIVRLGKLWESIPANATERQEEAIINNFFNFIAVKTFQLFKKYKIV